MFNSFFVANGIMTVPYADDTNAAAAAGTLFLDTAAGHAIGACGYNIPTAAGVPFAAFLGGAAGLPLHGLAGGHTALDELIALSKFVVEKHNAGTLKTFVTSNPTLFAAAVPNISGAITFAGAPAIGAGANVNFLVCLLFHLVACAEAGVNVATDMQSNLIINFGGNDAPVKAAVNGIGYTPRAVLAVGLLLNAIAG
jgi:hypothetical protein